MKRLHGPTRRRDRPLRSAWFAIAVAAAVSGAFDIAAAGDAGTGIATVEIAKFAFEPGQITVAPGTRVRWINRDETPHTVTSQGAPKTLSSPGLDVDDAFDHVFASEGDFAYFCTVHPMMTGVVHVRKAPIAAGDGATLAGAGPR